MIPNDPEIEQAVTNGEKVFSKIGCATCHIPALPLGRSNWIYTEPNPYNPTTNLRVGQTETLKVDLNDPALPQPRLKAATPEAQWLMVPAFTDFKLHDITDPADPSYETLGMNQPVWADKFTGGNRKFLTKRLWGSANEPPFFHHGQFTTLRASVLAHAGEALQSRTAFEALPEYDKDSLIEFLKSLQVLPPGTRDLVVDENFKSKVWSTTRKGPDSRLSRRALMPR
ncbi:MAG TPA: di-heme oxidoredictase family protein [Candidatus Angelobacter sp.]|nr:di-heme oxidoredictase family protein [Candidatus Angelobacter sp.]